MRCCVAVVALAWSGFVGIGAPPRPAAAGEKFPYTAYTNSDDVYIRSGPGKNYYPTDKLAKGESVEVYRQDPGGWYAIRPPQGSFSWVPSEALKPIGDHLAVVQKDHTPCFVGTRFSNARDVHQVRLDQGEQVEILDIKQLGDGADAQSWCQIAPPSGEFRWVFGKFIDRELPPGVSNSEKVARIQRKSMTARRKIPAGPPREPLNRLLPTAPIPLPVLPHRAATAIGIQTAKAARPTNARRRWPIRFNRN